MTGGGGGGGGQRDLARGCVHARANECKRGWWIWRRDGGRDTRREKLRELFPCRARHPFTSLSLLPTGLLRRSFAICATRTSSLLRTVVGRETVFPVHTSARRRLLSVSFSLSQTVSAVSHKKRNRKFMTVLGSFGPLLTFLLFLRQSNGL